MAAKKKVRSKHSRPTAVPLARSAKTARSRTASAVSSTKRKRTSARKNPAPVGGVLMGTHVRLIEYIHATSAKKTPYVHHFPAKDGAVRMYAMPDGSLRIVGSSGKLWGKYITKDSE